MKILQLIYSLSTGGAEKFVVDLSNNLAALGHEVTICILLDDSIPKLSYNRQFLDTNVKFYSLGFDSGFSLSKVRKVESYISSLMPDVVHCHLNVIPYIFRYAFFHRDIKFFHTIHSIADKSCGPVWQYPLNKYFYSKEIVIPITISKECQRSYCDFYKLNNAHCIYNGCSQLSPTSDFNRVKKDVSRLKNNESTVVFIHVARCSTEKNQKLLINVFNKCNQSGLNFILLMLGSGYDSKEGRQLQSQACEKIFFLGQKNNVADYLLCSDAFCLTSKYEGLPISLIEALSCGVTPICTSVGGIPDIIVDKVNGYLSADTSEESYISAINDYIAKPINRADIIDCYKRNFSMTQCVKTYELLFFENLHL